MKNLGTKLALLGRVQPKKPQRQEQQDRFADTTDRLERVLGARLQPTERGEILLIERRYPIHQRYGNTELGSSLSFPVDNLAKLYTGLEGFDMSGTLFFDTETTGLAAGSGTYAFLVGLGFFRGEEFITEQLLMRDHSDEQALLAYLSQRLQETTSLVSFNGRAYDAQLLATRYAMHRQEDPLSSRSHLDLLHICRRLWKDSRLPDCRLETLEARVLGAPRHNDVPGWLIPSIFFDFLRDKNPAPLKGVVEHNRRDLLAMVGLCSHLKHLFEDQKTLKEPYLCFGLARVWSALEDFQKSDDYYFRALNGDRLDRQTRKKAMISWSRDLKKRRQPERAALLWRRILIDYPNDEVATVELAKWLEHNRRDYRAALELVESRLKEGRLDLKKRSELEHRATRLRRRLG